jgi:hypothetical protein
MLRLRWRAGPAGADSGVVAVARQQADRAHDSELKLRQQQQRQAGWLEANAHLGPAYWQVVRELAWQRRTSGLIAEHDPPGYLRAELGPVPESTRGGRAWREAAAAIQDYRRAYGITDPDQALGPAPRASTQRAAWHKARTAAQQTKDRQERTAATRPAPSNRRPPDAAQVRDERAPARRRGPERAAG